MVDWIYGVGIGALGGLVWGLSGYYKRYQAGEAFDMKKMGLSLVIGVACGVGAVMSGAPTDILTTGFVAACAGIANNFGVKV